MNNTSTQKHNANSPMLRKLRKRAAQMLIDGHRFEVICSRLEISRVTLWRWRKSECFNRLMIELIKEVKAEAYYFRMSIQRDVLERMYQLAQSANEGMAYRAAAFLLKLPI